MAKITNELVKELALAVITEALDRYDEYYDGHIQEIAEENNVDADLLSEKVSDYLGKLLHE